MKRLTFWGGLLVIVGLAVIAAVLTLLFVGSLFKRDVALWGLIFTVGVAMAGGLADWLTRVDDSGAQGWSRLTNPRWLARLGMAVFFGLGVALFAQSFIAPTEEDLIRTDIGEVRTDVGEVGDKIDVVIAQTGPRPWRAFDNIDGLWGEEGCHVAYRFDRTDHILKVDLVRREPGMSDYSMVATILPDGEGDVLNATVERSSEADERGSSLVFTYMGGEAFERLNWRNKAHAEVGGLELDRCAAA